MAPDTSLHSFVNASAASLALPMIPTSPIEQRDPAFAGEEENVDPDAKLILSDFTQITEYFPMDLYRSMFFIRTLDHEYNQALDTFDKLARKLYDKTLPENEVKRIKLEMSNVLNLINSNRHETLAEASRLYETVDHAFNTLDNSISVSEEIIQNPPSATYFLPTPPGEDGDDQEASTEELSETEEQDEGSIKTSDLTPAHLQEGELKALRRRMKKSFQWQPTPACIKKELQLNGRWPLASPLKMRGRRRIAKLKRKRQRQGTGLKAGRVAETRKAVQARTEKRLKQTKELIDDSLPVAPDEPTYCYCNDVSYGEMIACENEFCPKEWFHLGCAGLTIAPRGKWWCRDCKPAGQNEGQGRKRKRA